MKSKSRSKSYDDRTDHERLHSNWKKAESLYGRKDWSACIMRVATSTEISANIYIRNYLSEQHDLPDSFVDSLLMSANGIDGKLKRLIRPASEALGTWKKIKSIIRDVDTINHHRNQIAHSGRFMNKNETDTIFRLGLSVISILAPQEAAGLELPE